MNYCAPVEYSTKSPILFFASLRVFLVPVQDGFPIYGQLGPEGVEMKVSHRPPSCYIDPLDLFLNKAELV